MNTRITIDGAHGIAPEDSTILEAAACVGIEIPTLCHHPDLPAVGSCRLCLVDVAGWDSPVAACVQPIGADMVVETQTPQIQRHRRAILECLLDDYYAPTPNHAPTEFQRQLDECGVAYEPSAEELRWPIDCDPHPTIHVDLNQCILCTRCVRACRDVQGRHVWGVGGRGFDTKIIAGADTTMLDAGCESCGACVSYCPTGALSDRSSVGHSRSDRNVRTTCGYCGVGCQFDLRVRDEQVVGVEATPEAPVNGLSLCVKGKYGWDYIHHADRVRMPMVRQELLEPSPTTGGRGEWREVSWEVALNLVADRFARIVDTSGADAIGVLSSAKCSNEENYLLQKFARQVIGTNNVDHCARLCHASTVAGLAMCYGSGAMSNSMDDIVTHAKAMFVIGSNTTEQHPVFGAMIRQAVRHGMKLVVADPRAIDLVEYANLHLRQRPGSDIALINGLMHIIVEEGWHDSDFVRTRCENFESFRESLTRFTPEYVSERTTIPEDLIYQAAQTLALLKPLAVVWAMGITQHTTGVMNVLSLGNLQMLLGNIGIPGGGVNPLRGQNNVQGACDMGALPNLLPGYQPLSDLDVGNRFREAWELDSGSPFDSSVGLTVTEMIDAAGSGRVRGLYIVGENPVLSDPDTNHVRRCLEKAELVVLQEIFPSATSEYADVLLPGCSFAERDGTFTNTERRIQRFRKAVNPPGGARADWKIVSDLARQTLEVRKLAAVGPHAEWRYGHPSQVMQEIAALTPSYAGVTYQRLERSERLQWPVVDEEHEGTPILHVDRFARGLGRFHAVDDLLPEEMPDDDYPLLLTTGRVLYHWHGGEMTRRSDPLSRLCDRPLVEISATDAESAGISEGDPIVVRSRRGRMRAYTQITTRVSAGVVFANFHFAGDQNANVLTIQALDPVAKIPEYKVCAVGISRDS